MRHYFLSVISIIFILISCNTMQKSDSIRIIFLHHSTGLTIWNGDPSNLMFYYGKLINKLTGKQNNFAKIPKLLKKHNKNHGTAYVIEERNFPSINPYGWNNYPYDYYNIWVKNAGDEPYMNEPTLELLTVDYDIVIFKHCFPVGKINPDKDSIEIDSDYKSIGNYKDQYLMLRNKMRQFSETKFIVWTGAALVKSQTNEEEAIRTKEFFDWVINEWDIPHDNIYIWDFYNLQTNGNLYFPENLAQSRTDSHPNKSFAEFAADLFFNRLIDVITNNGSSTNLKGELIY
ncbi:MAG: hypothetical protein JXA61_04725 [Bacteroidales bacterium]|nr:hypothetical protein [Bacteroidales bacterium]